MASKKESNFINMVLTLFVVSRVAALALGSVYSATKDPIAIAKKAKLENAIKEVLPEFDTLSIEKKASKSGTDSLIMYIASNNDEVIGTAVKTYTKKGFGGEIELIVGFLNNGDINKIVVVSHKETPGLGDKINISKSDFSAQFINKNPKDFKLNVTKDGGDVDAITAATISSRAFCDAVRRATEVFE